MILLFFLSRFCQTGARVPARSNPYLQNSTYIYSLVYYYIMKDLSLDRFAEIFVCGPLPFSLDIICLCLCDGSRKDADYCPRVQLRSQHTHVTSLQKDAAILEQIPIFLMCFGNIRVANMQAILLVHELITIFK